MNNVNDLQNRVNELQDKNESLTKYNNNLQETANKYALALKEEKEEKSKRIKEYTDMNNKYNTDLADKKDVHPETQNWNPHKNYDYLFEM